MSSATTAKKSLARKIFTDQRFFLICIIILISIGAASLNPRFLLPQNIINILHNQNILIGILIPNILFLVFPIETPSKG